MSALTSLLVRDRIVPVSKIEEALQTQVLSGGDIDTVLLEMDLVPEDVLSAYRAALFGLLPATRDEVMRAPREAVVRVSRDLARERNIVPLLLDGRALVVAAIEPLSLQETRSLRDQLGYEVSVRIVTRPRLLAGLSHHYGVELSPRTRRLVDALRRREPGIIPYVRPPSPSVMPVLFRADSDDNDMNDGEHSDSSPDLMPRGITLSEPGASLLPSLELERAIISSDPEPPPFSDAQAEEAPQAAEPSSPTESAVRPLASQVVRPQGRSLADNLLSGLEVGRATTMPPSSLSPYIARAARGPIDAARAEQLLAQAAHRDDALYVVLRYAQQFFDFVGLFSVGKEGARGRMAHGAGLSQELMEHLVIPLEGTGLFARAARDKRALVGDMSATDEERAAAALLGRPAGRPALVVPFLLRGRPVLLLHADRLAEGIAVEDAASISEVAGPFKDALSRIILQNKTLSRGGVQPSSLPTRRPEGQSEAPSAGPAPQLVEAVAEQVAPSTLDADEPRSMQHGEPWAGSGGGDVPPAGDELTAVDLESVSRPGMYRRASEPVAGNDIEPSASMPEPGGSREGAWIRLPGVPRTAPPPPRRESGAPTASAGAYRYVAATGLVAESVRKPRGGGAQSPALAPAPASDPAPPVVSAAPAVEPVRPSAAPQKPAAPANKRLSLVTPEVNEPSVIIDMGDQVTFLVEALLKAGKNDELPQIHELVRLGESALPVLIQRFPGPLWLDRAALDLAALRAGRIPRGRDVSAVARALCAFGDKAAPYLAGLLGTGNDETSLYALLVAGELVHPELLDAVARRVLGPDPALRQVAVDILRRYAALPQFATVLRALADLSERPGRDPKRQLMALEALGALRDARALETLIARLNDESQAVVQLAHRALVELTAQDFGPLARRWESWAEEWGARHRIEWLIESLMHLDVGLRALASDELKRETQQYFGYHPGLPKKDREIAQRKYREWWQSEGKAAFVR